MSSTISEHEEAFRRDPNNVQAFAALRRHYEAAQEHHQKLAKLYETHATVCDDHRKAADLLFRAASRHRRQQDRVAEARALHKAIVFDAENISVLDRLIEVVQERQEHSEHVRLLEQKLDLLSGQRETRRIAELHHDLGKLWEEQFCRLDKALEHYREAFRVAPQLVEAIAAGRRIYAKLGRWQTVVNLYSVQLTTVHESRKKAELLHEMAKLQRQRLGDLEGAASSLTQACQLIPNDEALMEALGEVYAAPAWPNPGGLDRAAAIFMQIAQRREARGDREGIIAYLRRALAADPENDTAAARLERAYRDTARWDDLDRLYRQRIAAVSASEAARLQLQRGELLEKKLGDIEGARECYEGLLADEPLGGPAEARLREIYHGMGDHERLLALQRRILDGNPDQATRVHTMLDMAKVQMELLDAPEAAAHLYHEVLQLDPANRRALAGYEDYFKQRGDYRRLAELMRFSIDSSREQGASPLELTPRLEALAEICEQRIGDLPGALEAWRHIAELETRSLKAGEQMERVESLMAQAQQRARQLKAMVVEASTPHERRRRRVHMARVFFDENIDPLRSIDILREILREDPHLEEAQQLLTALYEREADDQGLAEVLRLRLEGILTRDERAEMLATIADLYERLHRDHDALWAHRQLAELTPHAPGLSDKLVEHLERNEDYGALVALLERRAASSEDTAKQLEAIKRVAHIHEAVLGQPTVAADVWQRARAIDPTDTDVITALDRLYRQLERHQDRLNLFKERVAHPDLSTAERVRLWREIAQLAESELGAFDDALSAHQQLCELLPADRDALSALARLYEREQRHRDLCDVLARQLDLTEDRTEQIAIAVRRAKVLAEVLKDMKGAIGALEHVVDSVASGDLDTVRRLRLLHEQDGDPRRACELAEVECYLTASTAPHEDRVELNSHIADIWKDRLQEPHAAIVAFERVLAMEEHHAHSLSSLRQLYHQVGAYTKLVQVAPSLFTMLEDNTQRQVLLFEVAEVWEHRLSDPRQAFEWYRRAQELYGDASGALDQLRRLSSTHELWEDLLAVLDDGRANTEDSQNRLALSREMAQISHEKLDDPAKAFSVLAAALDADPAAEGLLEKLEELANASGLYAQLLAVYGQLTKTAATDAQIDLERKSASIAEGRLGDAPRALSHAKRIWELELTREATEATLALQIEEIERLAGRANTWDVALQIHLKRMRDAEHKEQRIGIFLHLADMYERKARDPARALDALLYATLMDPNHQVVRQRLWSVANALSATDTQSSEEDLLGALGLTELRELLGTASPLTLVGRSAEVPTDEGDQATSQSVPASRLDADELFQIAPSMPRREDSTIEITGSDLLDIVAGRKDHPLAVGAPGTSPLEISSTKALRKDSTMELTGSDLLEIVASGKRREDSTIELTGSEVLEVMSSTPAREDSTIELSAADVVEIVAKAPGEKAEGPRRRKGTIRFKTGESVDVEAHQTLRVRAPAPAPRPRISHLPRDGSPWDRIEATLRMHDSNAPRNIRAQRLLGLSEMWLEGAMDTQRSIATLVECAVLAPEDPEPRHRLEQLAAEHDAYDALLAAYKELLEHVDQASLLVELHLRSATLERERGETGAVEHHLHAVLAISAGHDEAFEQLQQLYRDGERWEQLAALLEERLQQLPPEEQEDNLRILTELADVYQHRLDRSDDAANVLARRTAALPEDEEGLARLAKLYADMGLWSRHVETLQSLFNLTESAERRCEVQLQLGSVFEQELELPHRAIKAYEDALRDDPTSLAALDALERLYLGHEKTDELSAVLSTKADLARDTPEEKQLRIRLARILGEIGAPERAAEELYRAREIDSEDATIDDALGQVLLAAGQVQQAKALLDQRIEETELRADGSSTARLLVRLAELQSDHLDQGEEAVASLERAIELEPSFAEALRSLALLQARLLRWQDFVATTLRRCTLVSEKDTVTEYLMASAALLAQHEQHSLAADLYAKVLEREPEYLLAIDELLALTSAPERRLGLLKRKASLVEAPVEKALTLVKIARLQQRLGHDDADSLRILAEARELAPDQLEVVDGLSAYLMRHGQLEEARALLQGAAAQLKSNKGRDRAAGRIYYRLGQIYEQLDRDEEGYTHLADALRSQPDDLLVRIALGKNRFRAARWPEALRHLREVAQHKDSPAHPSQAADALFHAGLCERRLRRESRAHGHFVAGFAFDGNHLGLLEELASQAEQQGNLSVAATHLERLGQLGSGLARRCELFHRAGQLFVEQALLSRAADCYEALLALLDDDREAPRSPNEPPLPPNARQEWLTAALETLVQAEVHPAAAHAAETMAGLVEDSSEQRDLLLVAAREHEAGGNWPDADAAHRAALERDPSCSEAALGLALSLEAQGRPSAVIELLTPFLEQLERPREQEARQVVARVYETLGRVHRGLDHLDAAIDAFEAQLDLAESEQVRKALATVYAPQPRRAAAALANHRILARNVENVESLAAIARVSEQNEPYRAYCLYQTLRAMGQLTANGVAFLAGYSPEEQPLDAKYGGQITEHDRSVLLTVDGGDVLREVFMALWETASLLLPRSVEELGVDTGFRVSPVEHTPLAKVYTAISRAIDVKLTSVYRGPRDDGAPQVEVAAAARPGLVVRPRVEELSVPRMRFALGRALELTQPGAIFAAGLPRGEFAIMLTAVVRAFHPRHHGADKGSPETTVGRRAERYRREFPYRVARKLGEIFRTHPDVPFDSAAWRRAVQMSANRVALVLSGDVMAAVNQLKEDEPALAEVEVFTEGMRRSPLLRDLLGFAASDAYYAMRTKLGVAGG